HQPNSRWVRGTGAAARAVRAAHREQACRARNRTAARPRTSAARSRPKFRAARGDIDMSGIIEMLEDLRRRDVKLWLDGADLRLSAPPGVLTPALIAEIKRCKPELCALLRADGAAATESIKPAPRGGPLPASFAQQQLFILTALEQGQAYHS